MKDKVNHMTQDTFHLVLQSIPDLKIRKWNDMDVKMLFQILYWCGLRPSEGIKLEKSDFDFDRREVLLRRTKTQKMDYAIIPRLFIDDLRQYIELKPEGRLLPDLIYQTMYYWIIRLGEMLKIPSWTISKEESGEMTKGHIFRKSIGKDMVMGIHGKKVSGYVVSKLLRHGDERTTFKHYLKVDIEQVKEEW